MEGSDGETKNHVSNPNNNHNKVSLILMRLEVILRIFAAIGTLASVVSMATSTQTLPLSVQFLRFKAQYNDFPAFKFFLIANSVGCGYLVFSLPFSVISQRDMPKLAMIVLRIFDVVMLGVVISGASAAVSIVYLAHQGNVAANWLPICPRATRFCNRVSASIIASFFSVLIFMFVIVTSLICL